MAWIRLSYAGHKASQQWLVRENLLMIAVCQSRIKKTAKDIFRDKRLQSSAQHSGGSTEQ
jgi:hypothetical protein